MGTQEAAERITSPGVKGELVDMLRSQGARAKMDELKRRKAAAVGDILAQKGIRSNVRNLRDIDRTAASLLMEQRTRGIRQSAIPGLLAPRTETVETFGPDVVF